MDEVVEEMEGPEVAGVVIPCVGLIGLRVRQDLMLLYPHPHEYFSCRDLRMIIQIRLPQVWVLCMNESMVCDLRCCVCLECLLECVCAFDLDDVCW